MPRKKKEDVTPNVAETNPTEIKPEVKVQPQTPVQPQPQFQPQPQPNVLFDANGNPVFVQPQVQQRPIYQESPEEKKRKGRKIGPFVASIVTLILSFVFMGLAVLFFAQFMEGSSNDLQTFLLFLIYLFTGIGLITFVPGLGLAITSVVCSCIALKSNIKALKIISIFTTIFSVIALIVAISLPFFLPTVFSATTGSGTGMGA